MQPCKGLNLRSLEVFMAIVETGSMANAAKRIGASPSAVSQQINSLESSLNVALFDRALRPIGLTPAGALLKQHATRIMDAVDEARAALVDIQVAALPQLRLAIIDSLDASITPSLLGELARELPDCNLVAWSGRSEENREALVQRAVDLIITADGMEDIDRLERHLLLREPYVLVTARGLLDGTRPVATQLERRPLVRYSFRMPLGRAIETHFRRLRMNPPHRYEFDSSRSVFAMVRDCDGWAVTTPLCALDAARFKDDVEVHPLPFPAFQRQLWLVARHSEFGTLPARLAHLARAQVEAVCMPEIARTMPWTADEVRIGDEAGTLAPRGPISADASVPVEV